MSQSLTQIFLHIVFSTKNRVAFLQDKAVRQQAFVFVGGVCKKQSSPSLIVGGVADHVHILCRLGKMVAVSSLIREIKRHSTQWIKMASADLADFHWQAGYGAFSVSSSNVEELISYILTQEQHHQHESFQDEFRRLCKMHGVEIDERYVWD